MKSRERALRAFSHMETDRPPMDFGGTVVTCLDGQAHLKLQNHLRMENPTPGPVIDYSMGTVEPREEIMRLFDVDFRRVALRYPPPNIVDDTYIDGFGIKSKRAVPHAYFDVISHPLENASIGDLDNMIMPDPDNPVIYAGLADDAQDLFENSPYCIIADFGVPGFYETCQKLMGYEQFMAALCLDPAFVRALFDRLLDLQKRFFANYINAVGQYVQVICYADDLGMQDRLQISPSTYRDMIKPYHKEIFAFIHERTDAKLMIHSCGTVSPIIGDFIEAGIDILNPVQTRASDMEPGKLKSDWGDKLVFWGGIDEQELLPHGSPDDVRQAVIETIKSLGESGGYILAPSHNIQSDTPPENIAALYQAGKEYRR
ncbi:MAG: uroporphyrinogen decarboxylase family protein [Armatimonadota bacterium]